MPRLGKAGAGFASGPGGMVVPSGTILSISDYADGILSNFSSGGTNPVFNGTFPFYDQGTNKWFASHSDNHGLQISGGNVCGCFVIDNHDGTFALCLGADFQTGFTVLWVGLLTNSTPVGTYNIKVGEGFNSAPATFTVVQIPGNKQVSPDYSCSS